MLCDCSNSLISFVFDKTFRTGRTTVIMSIRECLDSPVLEDEEGEEGRGVERESDRDSAVDSALSSEISDEGRTGQKEEGIGICLPGEK